MVLLQHNNIGDIYMGTLQIERKVKDTSDLALAKRRKELRMCWAGRYVEQLSGFALVLVALTVATGTVATTLIDDSKLLLESEFIGYILIVMGICQLYYSGLDQRRLFNLLTSSAWTAIAFSSFVHLGQWNILAAFALPMALISFYLFGYQTGVYDTARGKRK